MDKKSLVQELIATAAPVFIRKALQYLREGKSPTSDEITAEVLMECEVVQPDLSASFVPNEVEYAGPYGQLVATLTDIIDDMKDEIKSTIKEELRMEIFMQMEQLKLELISTSKAGSDYTGGVSEAPVGGLMQFEVTDDTKIAPVKSGYEAIKQYNALENNPLFKMVSSSVDRAAKGQSTHSAEEYIAARANRTDKDAVAAIMNAEQKFIEGISEDAGTSDLAQSADDVTNNDLWDKMFRDKYGGQ